MDADFDEKRRAETCTQRDKRWSMNSQRLEEIVAELMRPISDLRRSFDTDLSALLEEYLTEAGLHALAAEEGEGGGGPAPNFAELALLLQQSACIYGRKVDCLYQHVLSVSESLHNSTIELSNSQRSEEEPQTPSAPRRKRRVSACAAEFGDICVEPCAGARREAGAVRPPPTLPRVYIELEPRAPAAGDTALTDYAGEPIGLLTDFHVAWRLQEGFLVDELEGAASAAPRLRPIPLPELQAALAARAPSPPPWLRASTPIPLSPPPTPPPSPPPPDTTPPPPLVKKRERKRKSEVVISDVDPRKIKLKISRATRKRLSVLTEFSVEEAWVRRVVGARAGEIVALRRRLRDADAELRGFEFSSQDINGFPGWRHTEAPGGPGGAGGPDGAAGPGGKGDSDDDGFFEQSSSGESDHSSLAQLAANAELNAESSARTEAAAAHAEWEAWSADVARRAWASEARGGPDVDALTRAVLAALPPAPAAKTARALLRDTVRTPSDVSRIFLTTLFLANAGTVEIIPGAPLSVDAFSLRARTMRSTDARLYAPAAGADAHLPR